MDPKAHWDGVYAARQPTEVSWYQPQPLRSLELLVEAGVTAESEIIDVGGGDSTFVDSVVRRRLGRVTVLDICGAALRRAQVRLGPRALDVNWLEDDVTRAVLSPQAYDVWHDRAVFHFLTNMEDRARYVATAANALRPLGILIVATFASDGPQRCSGLEVARYSPDALAQEFGTEFSLLRGFGNVHRTPQGAKQRFTYAMLRRR